MGLANREKSDTRRPPRQSLRRTSCCRRSRCGTICGPHRDDSEAIRAESNAGCTFITPFRDHSARTIKQYRSWYRSNQLYQSTKHTVSQVDSLGMIGQRGHEISAPRKTKITRQGEFESQGRRSQSKSDLLALQLRFMRGGPLLYVVARLQPAYLGPPGKADTVYKCGTRGGVSADGGAFAVERARRRHRRETWFRVPARRLVLPCFLARLRPLSVEPRRDPATPDRRTED